MNRAEMYSLLLLAGGKSSRMGIDKAKLLYEGKSFIENLIEKAEKLGIRQMYLSGHQVESENVRIVWDIYPDRGPLGGVHACMKVMKTPFCLVLPVDVPQIPVEVLEEMLVYHQSHGIEKNGKKVPFLLEHGDRLEHLIGIYPITMVDFIEEKIKDHPAAVHRMLKEWGCECYRMEIPEWQAENINTREAYEDLLVNEERNRIC